MHYVVTIMAALALAGPAFAQDMKKCLLTSPKGNPCSLAKQIQEWMAEDLPKKISKDIVVESAMTDGPRLLITATWQLSKNDLDKLYKENGITIKEVSDNLLKLTGNSLCSNDALNYSIRRGVEIQYSYRTTDFFYVTSALIRKCPHS